MIPFEVEYNVVVISLPQTTKVVVITNPGLLALLPLSQRLTLSLHYWH
jgi:hypothetical protein